MKKIFSFLTFLALCINSHAQETWTNYTTSNSSILNNSVESIAIDVLGNKWIGTVSGVSKFDGSNWTNYTPSNSGIGYLVVGTSLSSQVSSIAIDAQGNKWFGIYGGGVSKFDGTNWTTYNTSNSNIVSNYVNEIVIDASGNKWIGTNSGLSKYDGTNWTTYTSSNSGLPGNAISALTIDAQGNKWIGTIAAGGYSSGVSKFDGISWTTYTISNSGLTDNYVHTILIDALGTKWFGTNTGGLCKFDGTNWTAYTYTNTGSTTIYSLAKDAQNNIWLGTDNAGVTKFDGTNWTHYNTTNSGINGNQVLAITIDAQGNRWLGNGGGISELSGYPLAIKLLSFTGTCTNNKNILSWQTTDEINNKGFTIERSNDGIAFETIGFVNANVQKGVNNYDYTDLSPEENINYYRLKIMDLNGSYEYSNTISLHNKGVKNISFNTYPNPVQTQLHFFTQHPNSELYLYDILGKQVMHFSLLQQENIVDVTMLSKGIYFYMYGNEAGSFLKE